MIGRRSFLAGILGAAAAPAIVKAESLMKIVVPRTGLYTGEIGVIDGFRLFSTDPVNQRIADRMTHEMLRWVKKRLRMDGFGADLQMPAPSGSTIRFRRSGVSALFVPSTPLHDLLHGDRKTA